MLKARLVKRRTHFTVDVEFEIASGGICGLFGVSGAGKSTILSCIAGIEEPDGGRVALDNFSLFPSLMPLYRRPIGYLTQDANLFPHLRVSDNVKFGVTRTQANDNAWMTELRDRLELSQIWHSRTHNISGGQARRVALARMLARKPSLVLLDEPFAGLDRHLVRELLAAIADWQRRLNFTMIIVDHESDVLERLSSRALVIEEGRIVQDASWNELRSNPATPLLTQLLAPL